MAVDQVLLHIVIALGIIAFAARTTGSRCVLYTYRPGCARLARPEETALPSLGAIRPPSGSSPHPHPAATAPSGGLCLCQAPRRPVRRGAPHPRSL